MSVRRRLDSAVTSAAWLLRGRMYEGQVVIMLKENNRTFIPLNKKNMVNFRTESIFLSIFLAGRVLRFHRGIVHPSAGRSYWLIYVW